MLHSAQIATEEDRRELLARERRQRAESERQHRIFDPRTRIIGVDKRALEYQRQEREAKEEAEKKFQLTIDREIHNFDQKAIELTAKEEYEKFLAKRAVDEYRKSNQRREYTREYDINDPKVLQKQKPPRCGDHEDVYVSAGQKFEGEDLRKKEREKVMTEQRSSWLKQQMNEKFNFEHETKKAEFLDKKATIAQDARALQLELVERECKKQIDLANLRYNKALASEKSHQRKTCAQNETQDNTAEIYNSLTSDLMTENPNAASSAYGSHRIIPYMYKGMSKQERDFIRMGQRHQISNNRAKLDTEKKCEFEWYDFSKKISNVAEMSNEEMECNRRLAAIKVREENMKLAAHQKEKQKFFDKIVYKNEPTEEYFNYFNTTSR